MSRQARMTKVQRSAWEPILAETLDRCRRYARHAPPRYGEWYVMDPAALEEAGHVLAHIMEWDGGLPLGPHHLWLVIKRSVRPRVRAAWITADGPQGDPEVRERHRAAREAGKEQRRLLFAANARGIQKGRLQTGDHDLNTLHAVATAQERDPNDTMQEIVERTFGSSSRQ